MNKDVLQTLQEIDDDFVKANRLVTPEMGKEYTHEQVLAADKSFTDYYQAMEDIRSKLIKLAKQID